MLNNRVYILCGLVLCSAIAPAVAQTQGISASALSQIEVLVHEKSLRTPAQQKIDSSLLLQYRVSQNDTFLDGMPALRANVQARTQAQAETDGRYLVDIKAQVNSNTLDRITDLGGSIVNSHAKYHSIRAYLSLAAINELAGLQDVGNIRLADQALTNKVNTSEGDVTHGTNVLRATKGIDGTGVKTCVLSDAVDSLVSLQNSGDLPAVSILPGQAGSGGSEGTAMLEIVHDLAPASELAFATAFSGQAQFAQNILDLRTAGCDVITDDIFYFSEPAFQDGIIAQAVDTVVDDGAFYFSSAGNAGNLNDGTSGVWEGDYSPTTIPTGFSSSPGMSAHSFGANNYNTITKDSPFGFALFWSDPQGGSTNDYDLFLLSSDGSAVVSESSNTQDGDDDAYEIIDSRLNNDVNKRLVVVLYSGENRFIRLATIRGELSVATAGETSGHSAANGAFSVAAVDVASASGGKFTGGGTNPVETFSSDGPRKMFFQADGTPYTAGNFSSTGGVVRQKPDIAAADGVATATPGFATFFGTSAAAPHAAAIAALHRQVNPSLTNVGLRNKFAETALDIEGPGWDRDSGLGIIMATSQCQFFVLKSANGKSSIICL